MVGQVGGVGSCAGQALTFPAMVRADWLTKASGVAGWPSLFNATEPAPPVGVTLPRESRPSAPMGSATTELVSSLVMKYSAFPDVVVFLFLPGHLEAVMLATWSASRMDNANMREGV